MCVGSIAAAAIASPPRDFSTQPPIASATASIIASDSRMRHAFLGHPLPHGIARMQRVWLDKPDLLVPGLRPRAPIIARQPQTTAGLHPVIPQRTAHVGHCTPL
jgi:hypothetical protein